MVTICRASRKTQYWSLSTPSAVGPGSYSISPPRKALDYTSAPFSTMTERPLSPKALEQIQLNEERPGPTTYFPTQISRGGNSNRGSNSFISAEQRMAPNAPGATVFSFPSSVRTPGPGTYNLSKELQKKKQTVRQKAKPMIFEVVSGPPSIPTYVSSPGAGNVGPGQYSPKHDFVKLKPGGADFSRSKDARKLWEPINRPYNRFPSRVNPGPGSYVSTPISTERDVNGNAIFLSKVNRPYQKKEGEDSPGPGSYDKVLEPAADLVPKPAFGSIQERGEAWAYDLSLPYTKPDRSLYPGVGEYNLDDFSKKESAAKRKRFFVSTDFKPKVPFLTDKPRDCLQPLLIDEKPGPGSYDTEKEKGSQRYNLKVESGRITFVSNQERFRKQVFESKEGPEPGQYQHEKLIDKSKATNSTFKSKTARFPSYSLSCPPIGAYELQYGFP